MNKKDKINHIYFSDSRYEKVWEQMKLLGIQDVSTKRQDKNGTITWRLPIKNEWKNGSFIEVGSFKSGYVRNNNSCYSNYQLNKRCNSEPEYYPDYEWKTLDNGDYTQVKTGKYRKFTTRTCKLIPIEIDRLEYLISYCLKNYYIKHANFVPDGKYVPKWRYDNLADAARLDYDCGHYEKIQTLEENLDDAVGTIVKHETYYVKLEDKLRDLENKLATIQRIADHG